MKKRVPQILASLCLLCIVSYTYAQDDCTIKLRQAQKLYEEGKIEKVPDLIDNCIESGFSKENRVTALRLLTLVYLYDDKIEKAEQSLLHLLKIQPEYQINRNVDPIEFIRLFASYNTEAIFSIGFVAGVNLAIPRLRSLEASGDFSEANVQFSSDGLGLNVGFKGIFHLKPEIDLIFEPKFARYSFSVEEDVSAYKQFYAVEKLSYIQLPILGSYYFYKYRQLQLFADVGLGFSLLVTDQYSEAITTTVGDVDKKSSSLDRMDYRKDYLFSGILGVGVKYKLKRDNFQFNIRYNIGMNSVVQPESLSDYRANENTKDLIYTHDWRENDYTVSGFEFMFTYNREFYIHKKKK